jgi:hypothetical protein
MDAPEKPSLCSAAIFWVRFVVGAAWLVGFFGSFVRKGNSFVRFGAAVEGFFRPGRSGSGVLG